MAKLWQMLRRDSGISRSGVYDPADLSFAFNGVSYPLAGMTQYSGKSESIENNFTAYCQSAYKANGVVFATVLARLLLFSEARFQWQRISSGRPGDLFGTQDLSILEQPWPNGTTGELLARMEQDVSLAGNFYAVRENDRLRRLRPDWVSIILSAPPDEAVESDVIGYMYTPGGGKAGARPVLYLPEEMCHWSPIPDPEAQYRGMSWLSPVVVEIQADSAATVHKKRFFDNAATPNLAVSLKESVTEEQFNAFVRAMNESHAGVDNAYRTLYMGGGADVKVVGADLRQLDFRSTQGAGETRITAAGGVPAVIVGLSEGLQAATYSNYGQARRKFGDHWARPQWRSACAALESIVPLPAGAAPGTVRLWYDDRDIAFLREDQKDAAEIQQINAITMRQLIDAGFEPDSVTTALLADDWSLLRHSGLYSVQLLPPTSVQKLPIRDLTTPLSKQAAAPPQAQVAAEAASASRAGSVDDQQLHHYWTRGEGLAKWVSSASPWTTLYHHLLKFMPEGEAKQVASRWFHEVFGFYAGSDLNRVTHGKPPRGHMVGPG